MLTQARLQQLLDYDPRTGVFRWRVTFKSGVRAGDIAGCICSDGYRLISVDGQLRLGYRLAWLYVHGAWPAGLIDHKDGVRDHDAIDNLRPATRAQNNMNSRRSRNNTSGVRGVSFSKTAGKWHAYINWQGKQLSIGFFEKIEEAALRRSCAELVFYGEFASPQAFAIIGVVR